MLTLDGWGFNVGRKTKSLMRKTRLGSSGHQIRNKCFVYCVLKVLDSVFPKRGRANKDFEEQLKIPHAAGFYQYASIS